MDVWAKPRYGVRLEDCCFYHSMDVPGYGFLEGHWDLRGHEAEYLGNIQLQGKRVLEVGPVCGWLSMWMESQGAEVVSVEGAANYHPDFYWNLPESQPPDVSARFDEYAKILEGNKNGYWLHHAARSSQAKVHYGNAYEIPKELGQFDICVIAAVLLHNKNPLLLVEGCARVTRETIVITDMLDRRLGALPCMVFLPESARKSWNTWWYCSPNLFVQTLSSMGFPSSRVTTHKQRRDGQLLEFFTVVASRAEPIEEDSRQAEIPPGAQRVVLQCASVQLRMGVAETTHLELNVLNTGTVPMSSSLPFPVYLSYHWRKDSGELAIWDGFRSPLPWRIRPREQAGASVVVRAPEEPGSYTLELTLVQEEVGWFEDATPELPLRIPAVIA